MLQRNIELLSFGVLAVASQIDCDADSALNSLVKGTLSNSLRRFPFTFAAHFENAGFVKSCSDFPENFG
jgi:hypothetical protein